ncbi:hypothetical protein DRN44_00625 [Thermococci archaeon]|nr:MAG: hypothetical protein DRN44_00625 [Thermococci archaeon]
MKVLVIGTNVPTKDFRGIGGAGKAAIMLSEYLAKIGTDVYVLPWVSGRFKSFFIKPLKVNNVNYIVGVMSAKLFREIVREFFRGRFLKPTKYVNGIFNKLKVALSVLLNYAYIELVLSTFDVDIVHIHGLRPVEMPFIEVITERNFPLVVTLHGLASNDLSVKFKARELENDIFSLLASKKCTLLTSVSSKVKEEIIDRYNVNPEKVRVILNGVDHEKFQLLTDKKKLRESLKLPVDKIVLLQVGTLSKRKNQVSVLKMLLQLEPELRNKIYYVIAGDGPEKKSLEHFCEENGISNCRIFGFIDTKTLIKLYNASDFLIHPAYAEGLPLVFLEALSAGLPIITFRDLHGVRDIYSPDCMALIPERSIDAMVNTLKDAINRQWDRKKIKSWARRFSWENVAQKYLRLYQEVIHCKKWKS